MSSSRVSPEEWVKNRRYGVIIDAGSSGSRVYVYSWKDHEFAKTLYSADELKGKIPIVERGDQDGLKWTSREEPGISTYGSTPTKVGEHLDMLLNFAQEVVPQEHHSSTPIFLMATAGMRLLPKEQQDALLSSTCNYMREHTSFFVSDCQTHVRIIPGELEGVYGWVAVNYLMGGFDNSIKAYHGKETATDKIERHHTFGFLDMGGASAQIAFEPEHHQRQEHMDDLTRIKLHTLDGRTVDYDVFVTTFLGYGSNEARRRYLEDRVKRLYASGQKNLLDEHHLLHLDDPCLPRNLNITDTSSTSVALSLHGTGDFDQCIQYTVPLLNKDADCPTKPCLFNGVHTPDIDWSVNKFVGISEYWYSSHDILGLGGMYDFIEYEKKATDYCSRDWASTISEHKEVAQHEISRYQMQCFKSAWIVNVLHEGIEIPRIENPSGHANTTEEDQMVLEQTIESVEQKNWNPPFQSIDTINDIQVSWTLGAMLLHVTSRIPLIDHQDGFLGHSTDDEGAHEIADGVSQSPHAADPHRQQNGSNDKTSLLGDVNKKSTHAVLTIALFILICAFMIWYMFKRIQKRHYMKRMNAGPNGGILGVNDSSLNLSSSSSSWNPLIYLSTLSHTVAKSTVAIRHWASRLIRGRNNFRYMHVNTSVNTSTNNLDTMHITSPVDMDILDDSIVAGNESNSVTISITNDRVLGASNKTPSAISKQYWNKKRYSGDSHTNLFQIADVVEGSSVLPYRTSSALGLANRTNSSSSLTARTGSSSPNLATTTLEGGNETLRPRSRMGFVIHEQSDEEEYTVNDGPLLSSDNPAALWLQNNSRLGTPRGSPRGSLDERRRRKEEAD
ncbi:Golgi apyrase [Choanephora cucurbitarum]|uniref:Golgi apyrase n=1 Tax=Choanephora cucurbitarum TaxID=101091 RepID=A0A1C7NDT2_9FUNG|nr:Golgi apyrase [Choanephora cucurbitarum]